jgi:hypothetical protein
MHGRGRELEELLVASLVRQLILVAVLVDSSKTQEEEAIRMDLVMATVEEEEEGLGVVAPARRHLEGRGD